MNFDIFLFFLFSCFTLLAALMVISLSNAVHSVLFLILVFCNVASLLLLLGAEFLSFMLIIVYVGAIAVLFLFVVMMLNIRVSSWKIHFFSIIPICILIFFILLNQFSLSFFEFDLLDLQEKDLSLTLWIWEYHSLNNIMAVGEVLYTFYSLLFFFCGFILLVAMLGAIVLTMHQRMDFNRQKIEIQLIRDPRKTVKFITIRK